MLCDDKREGHHLIFQIFNILLLLPLGYWMLRSEYKGGCSGQLIENVAKSYGRSQNWLTRLLAFKISYTSLIKSNNKCMPLHNIRLTPLEISYSWKFIRILCTHELQIRIILPLAFFFYVSLFFSIPRLFFRSAKGGKRVLLWVSCCASNKKVINIKWNKFNKQFHKFFISWTSVISFVNTMTFGFFFSVFLMP